MGPHRPSIPIKAAPQMTGATRAAIARPPSPWCLRRTFSTLATQQGLVDSTKQRRTQDREAARQLISSAIPCPSQAAQWCHLTDQRPPPTPAHRSQVSYTEPHLRSSSNNSRHRRRKDTGRQIHTEHRSRHNRHRPKHQLPTRISKDMERSRRSKPCNPQLILHSTVVLPLAVLHYAERQHLILLLLI